jgi:hypothetical protein
LQYNYSNSNQQESLGVPRTAGGPTFCAKQAAEQQHGGTAAITALVFALADSMGRVQSQREALPP